jgi:hypothetical protein
MTAGYLPDQPVDRIALYSHGFNGWRHQPYFMRPPAKSVAIKDKPIHNSLV